MSALPWQSIFILGFVVGAFVTGCGLTWFYFNVKGDLDNTADGADGDTEPSDPLQVVDFNKMAMFEYLSCPFCGSGKCTIRYRNPDDDPKIYCVTCWSCYTIGPWAGTVDEAISVWNNRTAYDPIPDIMTIGDIVDATNSETAAELRRRDATVDPRERASDDKTPENGGQER